MCCPDTVPFLYISALYIPAIYIIVIYLSVIYISVIYNTVIYIPVINYFLKPSSEDLISRCPGDVTSVSVGRFDPYVVPTPCHFFGRHLRLWWLPLSGPTFQCDIHINIGHRNVVSARYIMMQTTVWWNVPMRLHKASRNRAFHDMLTSP